MANTIRIKRRASGGSGAPSTLENAELAFNEVDETLYIGKGTGGANGSASTILAVAGPGAFVSTLATRTKNTILAGPTTGSDAAPSFRALVADDIPDVTGSYLGLAGGTVSGNLVISGNFTVNGTTTTVNSTTVQVDDKNLELGTVSNPDDSTADNGGITLKGTTDKTFQWLNATDAWTSSEHIDLANSKSFYINGSVVLSGGALGSGVTASSLTQVGTIASGVWQGTEISVANGGTGATTLTGLIKGSGTNALASATAGVDYLAADGDIDGGTF